MFWVFIFKERHINICEVVFINGILQTFSHILVFVGSSFVTEYGIPIYKSNHTIYMSSKIFIF